MIQIPGQRHKGIALLECVFFGGDTWSKFDSFLFSSSHPPSCWWRGERNAWPSIALQRSDACQTLRERLPWQTMSITLKLSFSGVPAMHHTRRGDAAVNQGPAHADVALLPGPLIDSKTNATTHIPPLAAEWNGPGRGVLKTIHPHNWGRDKNSVRGRSLSQTLSTSPEGGGASLSPALPWVDKPKPQWVVFGWGLEHTQHIFQSSQLMQMLSVQYNRDFVTIKRQTFRISNWM